MYPSVYPISARVVHERIVYTLWYGVLYVLYDHTWLPYSTLARVMVQSKSGPMTVIQLICPSLSLSQCPALHCISDVHRCRTRLSLVSLALDPPTVAQRMQPHAQISAAPSSRLQWQGDHALRYCRFSAFEPSAFHSI